MAGLKSCIQQASARFLSWSTANSDPVPETGGGLTQEASDCKPDAGASSTAASAPKKLSLCPKDVLDGKDVTMEMFAATPCTAAMPVQTQRPDSSETASLAGPLVQPNQHHRPSLGTRAATTTSTAHPAVDHTQPGLESFTSIQASQRYPTGQSEPLEAASGDPGPEGTRSSAQSPLASQKPLIVSTPSIQPLHQPQSQHSGFAGLRREQSLVTPSNTGLIRSLLETESPLPLQGENIQGSNYAPVPRTAMGTRKIWVKRPGASATLVSINEDDLVDDVRDMILRKYANSLGRCFDAPDVTLRIVPRNHSQRHVHEGERILGPEESMARTIDSCFPGGQLVDEALIIDVPHRRTPKHSPRSNLHIPYYAEEVRPGEGGEYFPPMPAITSPRLPSSAVNGLTTVPNSHHASGHSIAILNTGQVPTLPSPGARGQRHHARPRTTRNHTTSPPVLAPAPTPLNTGTKAFVTGDTGG